MNWKIDWEDINRKSRARRSGIVVSGELGRKVSSDIPLRREFLEVVNGGGGDT